MEKGIAIAAGALVVVPLSIWLYTSDNELKHDLVEATATKLRSAVDNYFPSPQPKCDNAEAVAMIKSMALEKINNDIRGTLVPGRGYVAKDYRYLDYSLKDLAVNSFRKRGDVGKSGSSCAAQITAVGGRWTDNFEVEYTIEPTTDGKTMFSARFLPNK